MLNTWMDAVGVEPGVGGGAGSPNNKMWEWGPSINRIYAYNNVMVALYYDICGQNFLFYYSFC